MKASDEWDISVGPATSRTVLDWMPVAHLGIQSNPKVMPKPGTAANAVEG